MRLGHVRNAAHRFNLQNPQIGLPAVELKEPIMIEAQSPGETLTGDGLIEPPARVRAIHRRGLHAKTDEAAGIDIQDQQHPMSLQPDGLAPEQVHTPQGVLGVSQYAQPRGAVVPTSHWVVVLGQDPSDRIFVQFETETPGELGGDLGTAQMGVAALHFQDGRDPFWAGAFGPGPASGRGRSEPAAGFQVGQGAMTTQEGGGTNPQRRPGQPAAGQAKRRQPEEQTVGGTELWGAAASAAQEPELLPQQEVFGQQPFGAARFEVQGRPAAEQVDSAQEKMVHRRDYAPEATPAKAAFRRPSNQRN